VSDICSSTSLSVGRSLHTHLLATPQLKVPNNQLPLSPLLFLLVLFLVVLGIVRIGKVSRFTMSGYIVEREDLGVVLFFSRNQINWKLSIFKEYPQWTINQLWSSFDISILIGRGVKRKGPRTFILTYLFFSELCFLFLSLSLSLSQQTPPTQLHSQSNC